MSEIEIKPGQVYSHNRLGLVTITEVCGEKVKAENSRGSWLEASLIHLLSSISQGDMVLQAEKEKSIETQVQELAARFPDNESLQEAVYGKKCEHKWVDTGTKLSFCKHCDIDRPEEY